MNGEYLKAGNPSTPASELSLLSASPSPEVRLRVAENPKCPVDVLTKLAMDECSEIRAAAGMNVCANEAVVARVAQDADACVRLSIAGEAGVPKDILLKLAEDADAQVRDRAQKTLSGVSLEDQLKQSGFQANPGEVARLGDLIVMSGILTEEEVKEHLAIAREKAVPLGRALVENRALSNELIVQLLTVQAALRKGTLTTEEALAQLEQFKLDSIAQRQTQRLQPARRALPVSDAASTLGIRSLIDTAPDGIVIFDEAGTVLEWSRQAEKIIGYTRRQALGMPFGQLLTQSADSNAVDIENLFPAKDSLDPKPPVELIVRDGRGGKIPLEITVSRDETTSSVFIAFIRDVSERKKLEDRRSAQYAVTRTLSQATSLASVAPDLLHILCETTGWDIADLLILDETSDCLRRIATWRSPRTPDKPRPEVYSPGVGIPGYVWQKRKSAWIDSSTGPSEVTPVVNQTAALGLPIMFQNEFHGVLYLMSKRMRLPEKDPIEMLANCCSQMATFIQRQRAEKSRQQVLLLQQREDFMATLAHDLKTPLISGERVLELLINGSLGTLEPEQEKVLQLLRESNQALLRMVKNLLSVYRYESGAEKLHLEPVDLITLVRAAIDEIKPMIEAKSLKVDEFLDQEMIQLNCDGLELRRVLSNLLGNAVKFTPEGGRIKVSLAETGDGRWVKIRVTDTGIGIPFSEQNNIFRRFWQGNQCHRAIGTGLGLHLCWKIVEAHGGKITCESMEHKGSTFTVTLPRTARVSSIDPTLVSKMGEQGKVFAKVSELLEL